MASVGSRFAIFAAGGAAGVAGSYLAYAKRLVPSQEAEKEQPVPANIKCKHIEEAEHLKRMNGALIKRLEKVERNSIERVLTPKEQSNLLGLMPKIWLEALNPSHIYTTVIYAYWQRWELSSHSIDFSEWMRTNGSLIDLPHMPRRLLDEWQVQYLSEEQKLNFVIRVENGLFVWDVDGTPCNIPSKVYPAPANATKREKAVASYVEHQVKLSLARDECLAAARCAVEVARRDGVQPTHSNLRHILSRCIKHGLLIQLRDPFFKARIEPMTLEELERHEDNRRFKYIPKDLLPGLTWDHVMEAIDHDQGVYMKESKGMPLVRVSEELEKPKGVFVVDKFGRLLAGSKVRGIFHHSSLCYGHAVSAAGGIKIVDGVLKQLSPHSGHFQPMAEDFEALITRMKEQGVDFTNVEIKKRIKV